MDERRYFFSFAIQTALVVQDNMFNTTHTSITICPVTSETIDAPLFRVTVPAGVRGWLGV